MFTPTASRPDLAIRACSSWIGLHGIVAASRFRRRLVRRRRTRRDAVGKHLGRRNCALRGNAVQYPLRQAVRGILWLVDVIRMGFGGPVGFGASVRSGVVTVRQVGRQGVAVGDGAAAREVRRRRVARINPLVLLRGVFGVVVPNIEVDLGNDLGVPFALRRDGGGARVGQVGRAFALLADARTRSVARKVRVRRIFLQIR